MFMDDHRATYDVMFSDKVVGKLPETLHSPNRLVYSHLKAEQMQWIAHVVISS
jgi:hypothetical protein